MDTLSNSGKKRQANGEGVSVQSMEEDSSKATKIAYEWAQYSVG
jgi:hypothetical protein